MIKTLIKTYHTLFNKSKLAFIEAFSTEENFFRNEVNFFDNGRVAAYIEVLKKEYAEIQTETNFVKEHCQKDDDYNERLKYLYGRQYEYILNIAFQASQNLKNIDNCLSFIGNIKDDFRLCLEGLKLYKENDKDAAFLKFTEYFKRKKGFGDHYLLNKFYGEILYEKGAYKEAEAFLYIVTQICPEDTKVHNMLQKIYTKKGDSKRANVEKEIVDLLGGAI